MPFLKTPLDVIVYQPKVFEDSRGFFYEAYNEQHFHQFGIKSRFPIESISKNPKGVVRGLHYQKEPSEQAKIVRVLSGKILDVSVDLRRGSPNFRQYFQVELTAENKNELYIPNGFAHGFLALEESVVMMKMSNYYDKNCEMGVYYADPDLDINWPEPYPIISEKDLTQPKLRDISEKNLPLYHPKTEVVSFFLSHSTNDKIFADKLYNDLLDQKIKCWYSPEDMKIGDRIRKTLEENIKLHDKLLLILSGNSTNSSWVEKEVETALEIERREGKSVLFPIAIDKEVFNTSVAWAADIRRSVHIGDFTNWRDEASYQKAFKRLLSNLNI